jgi:mannose-1-phosphate guanylyltransferase/mannose-6-phosphate isomerase
MTLEIQELRMSSEKIVPVILSGGSGTRLWPLSRSLYPKQLLPLVSDKTMLQDTVLRVRDRERFAPPVIVCNDEHRFIIEEQLGQIGAKDAAIVIEPVGRNTAPAVAAAAILIAKRNPDALLLVMPSDHTIEDVDAFMAAVDIAARAAEKNGSLVTFGINPTRPETGYGYIEIGAEMAGLEGCHAVKRFVEKPDAVKAQAFLEAGNYAWNSGLFLFSARTYLSELQGFNPEMVQACRAACDHSRTDLGFLRLEEKSFAACPSDSIDYAVMERTKKAAVVPVSMGWSDVGSWSSLWELSEKTLEGNVTVGDVIAIGTENSYLRSDGPALATVGLKDVVLVATRDAVLAVSKEAAQDVKAMVDRLKELGRNEHIAHVEVFRPWGSYQTTDSGNRFQVKRLVVKPGQKLSLQKHHHRAEHWIVVQGTAIVTRDDQVTTLYENESTYIPMGVVHRLENPGKVPLHIIEVQSGGYLGEDDIVRFEDTYGRT